MKATDLNCRRFAVVDNESGLSGPATIFEYHTMSGIVTGHYAGGAVAEGRVVGFMTSSDTMKQLFQSVTVSGELRAGTSEGKIVTDESGRYEINFEWRWLTSSDGGRSRHVEQSP